MRMHSGEKQMGMGTRRRRQRQERLWISHNELANGPAHPFYKRVNELLEAERFDWFAEKECARFYAENNGRADAGSFHGLAEATADRRGRTSQPFPPVLG